MKLFTKEINDKLFAQYRKKQEYANKGEQMPASEEMVYCKIFNPYGGGTWYIVDSDPSDPDYLWGIVDFHDIEMGAMSREELENTPVRPGLYLERDKFFDPISVEELWAGLMGGEHFKKGGQGI